jgi:hypothetical protein
MMNNETQNPRTTVVFDPKHLDFALQVFTAARSKLAAILQGPLQLVLPPRGRLHRRDNHWQAILDQRLCDVDGLAGFAEKARTPVQKEMGDWLSSHQRGSLPGGLLKPDAYEEVERAACQPNQGRPEDRCNELKKTLDQKRKALAKAQHSTVTAASWARGLIICLVITAGAFGVLALLRDVPLVPFIASAALVATGALLLPVGWDSWRRNRAIDAAASQLIGAYQSYAENAVALHAYDAATAAVAWLRGEAERRKLEQIAKAEYVRDHCIPSDLAKARRDAVTRLPIWDGKVEGRGPAVHSLLKGPALIPCYEELIGQTGSDLVHEFGLYVARESLVERWEASSSQEAVDWFRQWVFDRVYQAVADKTWADVANINPQYTQERLRELMTAAGPSVSLDQDQAQVQTALARVEVFVEHAGDSTVAQAFLAIQPNARIVEGAGPNEVRILEVGPRLLTTREILEGSPSSRNALEDRDRVFAQMPSPLVAERVAEEEVYERVTGTYEQTSTPADGHQRRDGDRSPVALAATMETST